MTPEACAAAAVCTIKAIPDWAVTPALVASIAAALSERANHLPPNAREWAQGYLDDCHDDMQHFAEPED